jgi:cell division septation protein DedD
MSNLPTRFVSLLFIICLLTISLSFAQKPSPLKGTANFLETQSASSQVSSRMLTAIGRASTIPPTQDENWYVIVGSYPKSQSKKANARARYFKGKGYQAFVVNSDDAYSFTPGLLVVVMGPFSKSHAQQVLNNVRSFDKNAYIKQTFFGT